MFRALVMVSEDQRLGWGCPQPHPQLPTTRDVTDGLSPREGRGTASESLALWENGVQDFVKKTVAPRDNPCF